MSGFPIIESFHGVSHTPTSLSCFFSLAEPLRQFCVVFFSSLVLAHIVQSFLV